MKKQLKNPGKIKFSAPIIDPGGGGAYVEFPFDTQELFGTSGRIPINVRFDGEPYRGTMLRYGTEKHIIIVVKKIREKIGKQISDLVNVQVELDDKNREVSIPEDVQSSFSQNQTALEKFQKLSYTHQKEYLDWIEDAKRAETRENRIKKMIDRLTEIN